MKKIVKQTLKTLGLYSIVRRLYIQTIKPELKKAQDEEKNFYGSLLKPGDLCFDIGANLGNKTEIFLELGAKVVAVEPQPYCLKELEARFKGNKNLIIVPKGVGEKEGNLTFYTNTQEENNTRLGSFRGDWTEEFYDKQIDVQVTTLEQLISIYGVPKYCKIDVEGFEINVLKGLTTVIPLLSFEYHNKEIALAVECLEYLAKINNVPWEGNVVYGNTSGFVKPQWLPKDSFIEFFKKEVSVSSSGFGDVFVRTKAD